MKFTFSPEGGEFHGLETEIHPLLIDHVLEKIFMQLVKFNRKTDINHLLPYRLVCKTWHQITTTIFRKLNTTEVQFANEDSYKLKRFNFANANSELLLHQNFSFASKFFIRKNQELFEVFLTNFSPYIVKLNLNFGLNLTMNFQSLNKTLCDQSLDFWSLKCLNFNCNYLITTSESDCSSHNTTIMKSTNEMQSSHKHAQLIVKFLDSILISAPNLKAFEYNDHCNRMFLQDYPVDFLITALPKKLTHLKLRKQFEDIHLENLQKLNLAFETFHIDLHDSSLVSKKSLTDFLNSQQKTLKDLKIDGNIKAILELPYLSRLTTLEIKTNILNFQCLKNFPMLHKIVFNENGSESLIEIENENFMDIDETIYTSVREVEIKCSKVTSSFIRKIKYCFPNLKTLKLQLEANTINVLCTVFQEISELKELYLEFPIFYQNIAVDTIFTGISIDTCRSLLEKERFTAIDICGINRKPNLTNLKQLKKFSIKSQPYSIVLTNLTAEFALMQLQHLSSLEMEQFNITPIYFNKLKKHFQVQAQKSDSKS